MRNLKQDVASGAMKVYTMDAPQLAKLFAVDPHIVKKLLAMPTDIYDIYVDPTTVRARRVDGQPFDAEIAISLMDTGWVVGNFE